jgi:putative ABC transport system permease protein
MKLPRTTWMALKSLKTHSLGSLLLLAVVILLTAVTLALSSLGYGVQDSEAQEMADEGRNMIRFNAGPPPAGDRLARPLRLSDLDYVRQTCPLITDVCALDCINKATARYKSRTHSCDIHAFTANYMPIRNLRLAQGRSFTNEEDQRRAHVAVLGEGACAVLFGGEAPLGNRIDLTNDYTGRIMTMTVIGVFQRLPVYERLNNTIYIPIMIAQDGFGYHNEGNGEVEAFYAMTPTLPDTVPGAEQMKVALEKRNVYMSPKSLIWYTRYQQLVVAAQRVTIMVLSICFAALLAGGLGIMKMMLLAVAARTPEIGLRKALGATPTEIRSQFLMESLLLGVAGATLGLALGAVAIYVLRDFNPHPTMRVYMPIGLFAYVVAVATISGILPARRAAALEPAAVLREG